MNNRRRMKNKAMYFTVRGFRKRCFNTLVQMANQIVTSALKSWEGYVKCINSAMSK